MRLPLYQVDAFADRVFRGNPAAITLLSAWPDDALLQSIAAENNLAETAYLVRAGADYELRWFTPEVEVELCGHATLASAHVIFELLEPGRREVAFRTRQAGVLTVRKQGELLAMDFPARPAQALPGVPVEVQAALGGAKAHGAAPLAESALQGRDYVAVLPSEEAVRSLKPDLGAVARLPGHGLIVTAPGREHDFVSRFFAPQVGVPEDPVTGSAHCVLTPYWAARLGKSTLRAFQASRRGGELLCEARGERVILSGRAALYLRGEIEV